MNSGNTNTTLLVVILLVLVGGGVWWYTAYGPGAAEPAQQGGLELDIGGNMPQQQ